MSISDIEIGEAYGKLKEGLHTTGYSFERALGNLKWLLHDERWRRCGFQEITEFLATVQLTPDDKFRHVAEQRKEIAKLIKEQTDASNRQIAKVLGVDDKTVGRDLAANAAPQQQKPQIDQAAPAANAAPDLTGEQVAQAAAGVAAREDRKARKQAAKQAIVNAVFSHDGPFGTVVMDPPWDTEKIDRDVRPNQAEFDYPTMTEDQIAAFWYREMVLRIERDCHLFLWTTQKFLPVSFRLIDAFRFRYVFTMTWHKPGGFQPIDLPQYNSEFVVYARQGSPLFVDTKNFFCCFEASRREHSRKPDLFYDMVYRVTGGSRIDVFSREPRDGFAQYGNERFKFVSEAAE
jgi:N6-adenosine-specific RNA methylase IME4